MSNIIRTEKQKNFRKEVSRLTSIANKRIKRLSESDFNNSPAYQKWLEEGGEKFGIRGKTQAEVWQEYYRVTDYLDSKTSSITGTKQVLNNMNEYTGMNLESVQEVQEVAPKFFELANKIEQYMNVKGLGAIYDSNQIYQQINMVTQDNNLDLSNMNVDQMLSYVTNEIENSYHTRNNSFTDIGRYRPLE